jgi:hypothetical protein
VDISSSSTVGHLKKTIQQEIPHRSSGIDAHKLQLFGISLQWGPNLAERVKDAIQGAVPLPPIRKIRDLFPNPSEEIIHIAVKLPNDAGESYISSFDLLSLIDTMFSTLLVIPLPKT